MVILGRDLTIHTEEIPFNAATVKRLSHRIIILTIPEFSVNADFKRHIITHNGGKTF